MSNDRRWLAAMLVGAPPPSIAEDRADALHTSAIDEGVVALVHERLQEEPCIHVPLVALDATCTPRDSSFALVNAALRRIQT